MVVLTANHPRGQVFQLTAFDPDIQVVSREQTLTLPSDVALAIVLASDGGYPKLHDYFVFDDGADGY